MWWLKNAQNDIYIFERSKVEVEVASVNWMDGAYFLEYSSFDFIMRKPVKFPTQAPSKHFLGVVCRTYAPLNHLNNKK
jgi:hypothetical protein